MKSYIELNDEEKKRLEELINEVRLLLPDYLELFSSEKLDSSNNMVLKTKQDYDNDKNLLLRLIEDKRKDGFINKEKSKDFIEVPNTFSDGVNVDFFVILILFIIGGVLYKVKFINSK